MDPSTLFSVAPTFPMDDVRIRDRSRETMLRSPITWMPLLTAAVAGFVLDAGVAGFVLLLGATAALVSRYWKKRRASVDAASLRELIGESNAAQDQELTRIIRSLESKGLPQYALCLGRFLFLKQKIEKQVHRGRHLAIFAQEVEKGVDGICAEVCREITGVRTREERLGEILTSNDPARLERLESARRESHAAILHAYTSLYQVHAEIAGLGSDAIERQTPEQANEVPGQRLQEILGGLRDEADMIARTHERIRRSMAEPSSPVEAPKPEVVCQ
jgi:predicted transcriptional regulator